MEKLQINEREQAGVLLVTLSGSLDTDTADTFDRQLSAQIERGHRKVLVDLQGVEYISSAGIGVLVGILNQLEDHGGALKLLHVSPKIARILSMLSLLELFQSFSDLDEALAHF
jgi:anti-anti-sigma factor